MALLLQAAFILVGFCRILRAFQARIGLADEAAPVVAARFGLVRVHTLGERRGRSDAGGEIAILVRSEEHTSELQSLMRISYAVFCLKKKNTQQKKIVTKTRTRSKKKHRN